MAGQASESQEISNIYISRVSGGTGGAGGNGGREGGGGGVGEGPNFRAATMHLVIQNHLPDTRPRPLLEPGGSEGTSRELSRATRNLQYEIGTRYRPYDLFYRPHNSLAGFDQQHPSPDSRVSSLTQSTFALNPLSHFPPQLDPAGTSPSTFLPFDPHFPHPINYQHPIDQASLGDFSTQLFQNHQPIWGTGESYHTFEHQYLPQPTQSTHGGTFITADTVNHRQGETGINILHRAVALEALYDSADSFPQPRCHPQTRTEMLNSLYNWVIKDHNNCAKGHDEDEENIGNSDKDDDDLDEDESEVNEQEPDIYLCQSICWLHGPAGAGKSAIMQTLCQRLQDAGRLGGAFFFKRGHATRGNPKVLFATLAYQLAEHNRDLRPLISRTVEDNSSVVARQMEVQLHQLIVEPCQSLQNSSPLILLIDGLDECETHDSQVEILRLIRITACLHPSKFRFLIASRPEAYIRETFDNPSFDKILNSINVHQSFMDVKKYFNDQFARIHYEHQHTMADIPAPWPPADVVESLVEKSSGYFVYASTVIRFIDDKNFRPTERLVAVSSLTPTNFEAPFEALDQLYIQILSGVPIQFRSKLLDILQCMIISRFKWNPFLIDRLLELQTGDTQLILRCLHSVLNIKKNSAISMHHASFLDFLENPQRSSNFHIKLETRMNVAGAVLKALSGDASYQDDFYNLIGNNFFECIAFIPPSTDLIPLIRGLNLDFIYWSFGFSPSCKIKQVLIWFKEIRPVPEDLVHYWQGLQFTLLWDSLTRDLMDITRLSSLKSQLPSLSSHAAHVLQVRMCNFSSLSLGDCQQFVHQFPDFVRIFQASWLFRIYLSSYSKSIHYTRLLLDVSWDQIIAAHSALCSIIGGRTPKQVFAGATAIFVLSSELYNTGKALSNLARHFLHLIQRVGAGDIPLHVCDDIFFRPSRWGELIRCSPHSSPELLQDLYEFVPPWELFSSSDQHGDDCLCSVEFHDVVQWLKEHPDPPLDLIERWQSYLTKSKDICKHRWDYPYEKRWRNRVANGLDFNKPPSPFDEEKFVQDWEDVLENTDLSQDYNNIGWILNGSPL
ncbi:hypothetical protein B0H14DRAFT_686540 [Mycena olivaceomarginata]|nr:hypothetical protein B0H14DRAFT_686540 [Mycena olivaceomarginata]